MKRKLRFWIELLAVIVGIGCVLAVFFGTVAASSGNSEPSSQDFNSRSSSSTANPQAGVQTYEGVVTDTRCGAKHMPNIPASAADCTRTCVHAGEHFALVDGEKVYVLEGERELLKRAAGDRVTLAGTLNGNTISVTAVRLP